MASAQVRMQPVSPKPRKLFADRRGARRFGLELPMTFVPFSDCVRLQQPANHSTALTHDVSTSGIYFTTNEPLTPGQELTFTLALPAEMTYGREIYVCGQARVLRTEEKREKGILRVGVAAALVRYEVVTEDPLYTEIFGTKPSSAAPSSVVKL